MRVHLSPEVVDSLEPPQAGERWVSDAVLPGFGVRLWAGKKGGGSCFAIRVRNRDGVVVRHSLSVWSSESWRIRHLMRELLQRGEFDFTLGQFLDDAREWAADKIREVKGRPTRAQRRHELYHRASVAAQNLTFAQMADRAFANMEKSGKKPDYVLQIKKLFWRLPDDLQSSLLMSVDVRLLAQEIANPELPVMQSRALQSFIGHLYSRLHRWYGPSANVSEKLNRHISALRRRQRVPHPRILRITPKRFEQFLAALAHEDEHWREALALKFYFDTGAKMRRVLAARWDQIVGNTWYPYSATERQFWFVGREPLDSSARDTLQLAAQKLAAEGRCSAYIFPRVAGTEDRSIATVRRYWMRAADRMGWRGLPLSHVVQRHRRRNTPSYLYMYSYMWVPISRRTTDPVAVSKFGKPVDGSNAAAAT